jgi:DHA2 family multidrug resistance protein
MLASTVILREYRSAEERRFDLVGFLSLSAFLTALLLALANGNSAWNTGGWTSRFILTCITISFTGLVVFLVTEFSVRHPLIHIELFRNFNFSVSNLVMFIFGLGMFGSNFLLPIYLQDSLGYTPFQAGLVFLPVGLILGVTGPFAGMFSDKYDARIPAVVGLLLLAFTFYKFSFLSLFSERSQIMVPLYLRGFAMGLLFSPLTTIAISEIPNRQMAQASGLINVIRQVGGSFGVAIFGTILTRRTIFHGAMYGQQLNPYSDAYRMTVARLRHFAGETVGGTLSAATARAEAMLAMFVREQAFVRAVDDVFLLAAIVLLVAAVPVFFLRSHKKRRMKGAVALE